MTFKISTSIAAAEVTVEPGAIRELHVSTFASPFIIAAISLSPLLDSGTQHKTNGLIICTLRFLPSATFPIENIFRSGHGRVTVFASSSNARTFDYQAGDIGFVPSTFGQ